MRCKKILPYLNAYVDDELPEGLRRVVQSHLAACESCQERLKEIREVNELLHGGLAVPPVPQGLAPRIMAEARRRQATRVPGRHSLPAWNPLRWIAGLSVPMRAAACATALLALVTGLSLNGAGLARPNESLQQEKDVYGFEWFAPAPPGSIGSVYIAMADQPEEKGSVQ